jgi:hypothetical protein
MFKVELTEKEIAALNTILGESMGNDVRYSIHDVISLRYKMKNAEEIKEVPAAEKPARREFQKRVNKK